MADSFAGFMSYVRLDDHHENGRLTELCARLSGEVRMQLGEKFPIFQDRNDVAWGQQWQQRIEQAIDATTFLIPIITPGFFRSPACRDEVERFLQREKDLGRSDLILPIYYVNSPILSDETLRKGDDIAEAIATRQYADWRELRFEPFSAPAVGKTLASLAGQVVRAFEHSRSQSRPATSPSSSSVDGLKAQLDEGEKNRNSVPQAAQRTSLEKKEPPTLIVDALHRGDHSNLTEALDAAQSGYRILVRPGLYREGISIDKAVEIIGDGEPGDVVIEASGRNGILFRAHMGRIVNLTVRQIGGGSWFGVDIGEGRLDMEGCDITSMSLAAVAIHGGADPRLRRNRIHDGLQGGILVYENGLGTLEDNEIFSNGLPGVEIRSGGNPTLRRNRIHDGKQSGVFVQQNGLGTFEDNEIFGNELSGVEIKSGGNPTLRRNRIHSAKQSGIYVNEDGLGTLDENEIFGNGYSGVAIASGGNPTLRRNRIFDGKQTGVRVYKEGLGILDGNEIFGNGLAGVSIESAGNPTFRHNRIHGGKQGGVRVVDSGLGTLERNEIVDNEYSGIEVKNDSNPTIRRNHVQGNGGGVFVNNKGLGTIEHNEIVGNKLAGVTVKSGGNPKLRGNRIHDNEQNGIYLNDGGLGYFEDNYIFSNAKAGVSTTSGANPTFRLNRIRNNGFEGIRVTEGGQGEFVENDVRSNARGAFHIADECRANVKIEGNKE